MGARLKSAILGLGGLALIATGIWTTSDALRFLEDASRAEGVVVKLATERARGMDLYKPVVQFDPRPRAAPAAPSGRVEFTASPALWPSPFEVGDRVIVAFHAAEPKTARVASFWTLWFMPLLCTAVGVGCVIAAWHTLPIRPLN